MTQPTQQVTLQVTEKAKQQLILYFQNEIEKILSEIDNKYAEIRALKTNLEELSGGVVTVYDPKFTIEEKINYVLKLNPGFLTMNQIVDTIASMETDADKVKITKSVSAVLSMRSKENGIYEKKKNNEGRFDYKLVGQE